MSEEEKKAIKNLTEIIELIEEEINNNNKNTTAILDIKDLKSLKIVLNLIEKNNKEINLMAKYIGDNISEEHCKKTIGNGKCKKYGQCLDCIKECFEKKVEGK